jgi:hypothetical protein
LQLVLSAISSARKGKAGEGTPAGNREATEAVPVTSRKGIAITAEGETAEITINARKEQISKSPRYKLLC